MRQAAHALGSVDDNNNNNTHRTGQRNNRRENDMTKTSGFVLLFKYYLDDQIKEDKMSRAYSTHTTGEKYLGL